MKQAQLLVVALAVSMTGCASITDSKNQPLSVTTTTDGKPITGANCKLSNDKGEWYTSTPGSVVIQKSYSDLSVSCKKDPKYSGAKVFSSSHEGAVWGNLLTGGIIGYAVDASSGAGFAYPPQLNINMVENSTQSATNLSNNTAENLKKDNSSTTKTNSGE